MHSVALAVGLAGLCTSLVAWPDAEICPSLRGAAWLAALSLLAYKVHHHIMYSANTHHLRLMERLLTPELAGFYEKYYEGDELMHLCNL